MMAAFVFCTLHSSLVRALSVRAGEAHTHTPTLAMPYIAVSSPSVTRLRASPSLHQYLNAPIGISAVREVREKSPCVSA